MRLKNGSGGMYEFSESLDESDELDEPEEDESLQKRQFGKEKEELCECVLAFDRLPVLRDELDELELLDELEEDEEESDSASE